jgi:hypothetical protein
MNTPDIHNHNTAYARCVVFATLATLTACGPNVFVDFDFDSGGSDESSDLETPTPSDLPDTMPDMPADCEPGTLGCPCSTTDECYGDLVCNDAGKCEELTPVGVWAEVRCIDQGSHTSCLGRSTGSEDAWVWVVPECSIEELDILESDTWPAVSCAGGQAPDNFFPEHHCGSLETSGVCWTGGDGWFTFTSPLCDVTLGNVGAWPSWQCGGAAPQVGSHPWDDIVCWDVLSSACLALDGETAMMTLPTCWIDQYPVVDPPLCD